MPRISMQQAYDNRDVIAQIYKMMAEVADALEKATDAVSKALEAIEAAEDAGEAAEAAQQTADGKQDALTAEQLAAVDSGITAAKVAEYDGYETLPDFTQATEGDALVIGSDGPEWGDVTVGWEIVTRKTANIAAHTSDIIGFGEIEYDISFDYLALCETEITYTDRIQLYPLFGSDTHWCDIRYASNASQTKEITIALYKKKGSGIVTIQPQGCIPFWITAGNGNYFVKVDQSGRTVAFANGLLPTKPSTSDVGKAWVATSTSGTNGTGEWRQILPVYSASDAGKVLSVNSSGALEWITPQ